MTRIIQKSSILAATLLLAVSCDTVRRFVGRPTSEMIEAKAERIRKAELEAVKAREDSIARATVAADSIVREEALLADGLAASGIKMVDVRTIPNIIADGLDRKFYIMVGTFSREANAGRVSTQAASGNYAVAIVRYRNGLLAVGLCPSDDLKETFDNLQKLRLEPFCPKDAWILVNEK